MIIARGPNYPLSALGSFGQVIRKNYLVSIGDRQTADRRDVVSVVDPLCTPLDLLADRTVVAKAKPGRDLVMIFQAAAYGFAASPQAFLGHRARVEVLI
jgi:diaminopimelate decarboxylase